MSVDAELDPRAETRILDALQGLLPRQVVDRTGCSYADVAQVLRKHGGLTAIRKGEAK